MSTSVLSKRDAALFPTLTDEQLAILNQYGEEVYLEPDERLFAEGDDHQDFHLLLEGRLKVTRNIGGEEVLLTIHEPGGFTGALGILSGERSIASAYAIGRARVRRIDAAGFRRILIEQPEIAGMLLASMAARRPAAEAMVIEREKLASLGKMAAGLAHELNNPASAARRAADELRSSIVCLEKATAVLVCKLPQSSWEALENTIATVSEKHRTEPPLTPLERSDREEAVGVWLEEHGVEKAWKLAPTLSDAGMTEECLATVGKLIAPDVLGCSLSWIAARLEADGLLLGVEQSASRIADLVTAIKSYSYMDQAPHQSVDIARDLENTLTILAHKWRKRGIDIVRNYTCDLPKIEGYGGELNQVWTNLLDNAIDAAPATGGKITVEAAPEDGNHILVAITDNGSGIPPSIGERIFEPFFTTKAPGKGTGLGLDTTYRIVTQRHCGDIRFFSRPGETRFEVRLPLKP